MTSMPEPAGGLRIIKLTASNFKRLRAVEITPDSALVRITGRNAQGKTSVLGAIEAALAGVDNKATPRPIREGETHADVTLNIGEYIIHRSYVEGKPSALTVHTRDGAKVGKAQTTLDGLLGSLSFDPLQFANMDPKAQVATLLKLVSLPFDPAALADKRSAVFDRRTDVNRHVRELTAQLAAVPEPPKGTPLEEVSVLDLIAEFDRAQAAWQGLQSARDQVADARDDVNVADNKVAGLRQQLDAACSDLDRMQLALEQAEGHLAGYDLDRMPDIQHARGKITSVDEVNRAVRQAQERERIAEKIRAQAAAADGLSTQLVAIDDERRAGLAAARFPIAGLSFGDDGVEFNGVPFKQASSAEQLRVSLAMAMGLNPELRVIRISDGSLLDSDSLRLVEEMAEDRGYQVWIELVDESGENGFVIEDGSVTNV